MITNKWFTKCC